MRRVSLVGAIAPLVLAACAGGATPSDSPSTIASAPDATASVVPSSSAAVVVDLEPGPLEPGVTYVLPDFGGLAVRMPEDGWLATLPNGGDVTITGGRTVVYLLRPDTVIAPDQSGQIPWPGDAAAARAALDAARGVTIDRADPITVAGIDTELLHLTITGASETAPLLTTGSGEFGLEPGDLAVLLPLADRVIVIGIGSGGDAERALEEGRTLLEALLIAE
jgi:hypothetical protein